MLVAFMKLLSDQSEYFSCCPYIYDLWKDMCFNFLFTFEFMLMRYISFACRDCPMLDVELPDLLPELRPYQRRAAYWMVEREKAAGGPCEQCLAFSPLCMAVNCVDSCSTVFYNPFRYVL